MPPRKAIENEYVDRGPPELHEWTGVHDWALGKAASSVNKLIYEKWKEIVAAADQTVVQVQRKLFSATFGFGAVRLGQNPEFYKQKYIVSDVLKYRAAAVATLMADRLAESTDMAFDWLNEDWQGMFSPSDKSYRSLNRTLMNLPGGVSVHVLLKLGRFILPRPITDRLELITTCLANGDIQGHPHHRVLTFSTGDQIREAMALLSQERGSPLSSRRWRDVQVLVRFLGDYPVLHHGNLANLTERAIRFHRNELQMIADRALKKHHPDTKVHAPPVPLPDDPGIRFLATVGDLLQEGTEMQHCIASYASRAVHGNSYLFHVDYAGEKASIEVDSNGYVIQAQGPKNRPNEAAAWGTKVLGQWGRRMRRAIASGKIGHVFPDC